jgi:biotin carboxyl carrier protein
LRANVQPRQDKLFRKVALERLSSPEQLDQLMRVVPPLGWLALIPLLGLVVMAVSWGWFGSVATKVVGRCILISPAGLADVASPAAGRITEALVRVGDTVRVDQVVARVAQPELADRIEKAESRLRELESQGRVVRNASGGSNQRSVQSDEARQALESLLESRRQMSSVLSPHEGRVVDLKIGVGSLVAAGSSLMTIERASKQSGHGLQAAIYVPATEGGKVRAGMTAEITPSTVKREQHGFVFGEVTHVSDYPATAQSMMLLLQNEAVVRELSGSSPVTEVRAVLAPAGDSPGYRWTSPAGASVPVKSGTLCTAEIVLGQERPASLVVPGLKKALGVD